MKKIISFILILSLAFSLNAFSAPKNKTEKVAEDKVNIVKSSFQHDTYTIYDEISVKGENIKQKQYDLPFDIPANKIVVLSLLNILDEDGNVIPENSHHYTYTTIYIGLKETKTKNDCKVWTGGYSFPSRIRFFRTTEEQNGRFTVNVGLEHIAAYTEYPEFTWKFALSIKLLDVVEFEPLDSLGKVSGNCNFFISSGPEALKEEHLYTDEVKQHLCRAPINGNANIYWSHLDNTEKNPYFGILLTNEEAEPLEISFNSFGSYSVESIDEAFSEVYMRMFREYAEKVNSDKETVTINPGESKWLNLYRIDSLISGETTGIINLSVNGGEYTGENLICTTYIFEDEKFKEYIPENFSYEDSEAKADDTAMRGSGNGAVLNLTGEKRSIPFETVLAGENTLNIGENVLLSRKFKDGYYTADDKGIFRKIKLKSDKKPPALSGDDTRQLNTYNCNFGTIYKIDLDMLELSEGLEDGKRLSGKIKYSARTSGAVSQYTKKLIYAPVLNMTVWRTKHGVVDSIKNASVSMAKCYGIDPESDDILYPFRKYQDGEMSRGEEGVYWEFDSNMPCYDDENEYSYYIVGGGLSSLPFEISFDTEEIELSDKKAQIYINNKPVDFGETTPEEINGTTMVPLRKTADIFGNEIYYNDGKVTVFAENKLFMLKKDSEFVTVFDMKKRAFHKEEMREKAYEKNGTFMAPLRDLCEMLYYSVDYHAESESVFIK